LRKAWIGALAGALVFAVVGVALASQQNNTVSYSSKMTYKGKGTKKKPKNLLYRGILHIGTTSGSQPNTAPVTDVFFARQIKNNASIFKSCKKSDIDGKSSVPPKCRKAQVGDGSAKALVGQPGSTSSLPQTLSVVALNGPKGKQIMLAVKGGALPSYRVISGPIRKIKKGKFGFKVSFTVPPELQNVLGSQIALTDFDVKLKTAKKAKQKFKVKGKTKTRRVSLLQITGCPKSHKLPTRATVHFNDDAGNKSSTTRTSNGTSACH